LCVIEKETYTETTHIHLMNQNKTAKAVSWMLWQKLHIQLLVAWGRQWMPPLLSMVDISSTSCVSLCA